MGKESEQFSNKSSTTNTLISVVHGFSWKIIKELFLLSSKAALLKFYVFIVQAVPSHSVETSALPS